MEEEDDNILDDVLQDWLVLDIDNLPKYIIAAIIIVAIIAGIMLISGRSNSAPTTTTSTATIAATSTIPPGAINITVMYGNVPANGAAVTIPGYYKGVAGGGGNLSTGFTITPGTYDMHASYNGSESSMNVTVSPGQTSYVTISIPGPIITASTTVSTTINITTTVHVGA